MGEPRRIRKTSVQQKIVGCFATAIISLSAIFGSFYILLPLLPLMFINHTIWRKIVDRLVGFWLILPSSIVEYIYGVQFTVTGDKIETDEPALFIMNHRTRLDWLFFWNALFRIDPWLLTTEKISLKGILKHLPGVGWAMGCSMYIFLDRSFDSDHDRIKALLNYYKNSGFNYQLLLFPEGTDKCEFATARNDQYEMQKHLEHFNYVLHPKTTGFAYIVNEMRRLDYIKNIYDVTVGYADSIVQSEMDLFCHGACPRNVHFCIRKIPIATLPQSETSLSQWLKTVWKTKEKNLAFFYEGSTIESHHFQNAGNVYEVTPGKKIVQASIVIVWLFMTAVWFTVFWMYNLQFVLAFLAFLVFIGSQVFYGGIEWIAVRVASGNRR
uniref:PlsC domain-containing protein n=1 Tax=Syphacia muris TaxID=451379 RepID=A0A0N5B159_9BILA